MNEQLTQPIPAFPDCTTIGELETDMNAQYSTELGGNCLKLTNDPETGKIKIECVPQ